jgi:hypothetical protein
MFGLHRRNLGAGIGRRRRTSRVVPTMSLLRIRESDHRLPELLDPVRSVSPREGVILQPPVRRLKGQVLHGVRLLKSPNKRLKGKLLVSLLMNIFFRVVSPCPLPRSSWHTQRTGLPQKVVGAKFPLPLPLF